ncbi:MAG: OmpH family outer membrane protein [Sphingobacteriia bacterium]|jgi:outer membrane protein|nr:OmpH family outer membrane protein [Candidatus Fonsibacter lacus]
MTKLSFKKTLLILAATGAFSFVNAQKIAHISFDSLVGLMPETKTATEAAQIYLKGLEQEIVAMQTEFESKYKDYMEKEATMGELLKKNKQEDLQQLQKRIEDFKTQAGQDYQRKQAELTSPIIAKAKKGIEAVAKEGGYKYVLDASLQSTSVLYSEPSDDILASVRKKLETMPLAVIPGTNNPANNGNKTMPAPNKNNGSKGGK